MSKQRTKNEKPEGTSKHKPPQPGEQSEIARGKTHKDDDGTLEKDGNVEPQQG